MSVNTSKMPVRHGDVKLAEQITYLIVFIHEAVTDPHEQAYGRALVHEMIKTFREIREQDRRQP